MRLNRRAFLVLSAQISAVPLLARCGTEDPIAIETATPAATEETATATATAEGTSAVPTYFDSDLHQLVSKQYSLASDYVPPGLESIPANWVMGGVSGLLRADILEALEPMMDEAWNRDEVDLRIRSAYRSYADQVATFQYWVGAVGEEQARRESAEAGHSEHQLGTTMDFADPYNGWELLESFADSPSGLWLAEHAWEYGFALSYPRDSEEITGYIYEPWHHRYIGVEAAAAWHDSGLTLIEFLEDLNAKAEAAARRRHAGG